METAIVIILLIMTLGGLIGGFAMVNHSRHKDWGAGLIFAGLVALIILLGGATGIYIANLFLL